MKTRSGFVSNSSTSSFVLLGIKIPRDIDPVKWVRAIDPAVADEIDGCDYPEDEARKALWDGLGNWRYHSEDGYIGIQLAYAYEDDNVEVSIAEIQEHIDEIKRVLEIMGIEQEPKLHAGTVMS